MYTRIDDRSTELLPENRSRGKAAWYTLPVVLLFILVGLASTRSLLNVNANNDLESLLGEPGMEPVGQEGTTAVLTAPVTAPEAVGTATACATTWEAGEEKKCKIVMTLDMGSSGVKPSLWAMTNEDEKQIPNIERIKVDGTDYKPTSFCGLWLDDGQYLGDKKSFCNADDNKKLNLEAWDAVSLPQYFQSDGKTACKDTPKDTKDTPTTTTTTTATTTTTTTDTKKCKWSCNDMFGDTKDTKIYFENWKMHFKNQMKCFLNKKIKNSSGKELAIKDVIAGIYGGITAGLRNDPDIGSKFQAFHEETGLVKWLKDESGKNVHMRMLSGEEEAYYEWIGFNWATLRKFNPQDGEPTTKALINTFTVGGASAQMAIVTAQPMNALDHTYYFHIGVDKYWIYANSIMWAGLLRLKNMVKVFADGDSIDGSVVEKFFRANNKLLCSDICNQKPAAADQPCVGTRLYSGACVMGFHLPHTKEWLTFNFRGNRKEFALLKCTKKSGTFNLNWGTDCDVEDTTDWELAGAVFGHGVAQVALPFWGRFFKEAEKECLEKFHTGDTPTKTFNIGYETEDTIGWGEVWAAMWLHGSFQGFPNIRGRRNLQEVKGEYKLGPLTIPAYIGTPDDEPEWS